MRLLVVAIGRLKDGPERRLFEHYWQRLEASGRGVSLAPAELVELPESRAATVEARKADEAQRLLKAAQAADHRIVLDEHGRALTSTAFAAHLGARRDAGDKLSALLIGGPDGHGAAALQAAQLKLSLGAMTLPHGLARIVLAEQLYRVTTILAGHPYHRGG